MPRIAGIVLVRDEDVFVEQAVRNVSSFCDELILVDDQSRDGTPAILARLADELPHATAYSVRRAADSHELIKDRAGERLWVFAVDGDELYDPRGLSEMRARLLAGEFDDW
jgi:glycosyltransferase involved in cell wall biosynthesis